MTGAIDWSHVAKYLRAVHGLTCPLASRLQPRLQLDELGCASSFESSDCFGNNGGQAQTQGQSLANPSRSTATRRAGSTLTAPRSTRSSPPTARRAGWTHRA